MRVTRCTISEKPHQYGEVASSGLVVANDPVNSGDPTGEAANWAETLVSAVTNAPAAFAQTFNSMARVALGPTSDDPAMQPSTRDYVNTAVAVVSLAAPEARFSAAADENVASSAAAASASTPSRSLSVEQAGADLAQQAGTNRVSVMTPSGRMSIDLAGKAHFDKASGQEIPTPHVKFQQLNTAPNGRTNLSPGTTRAATMQDIRTARNVLERRKNQ